MKDDDEEQFTSFVIQSWPRMDRVALALTGDRHDADDLLQNAYAKAYSSWTKVRQVDHPEAYVRRILANEYASSWRPRWRKAERPTTTLPDQETTTPHDALAANNSLWQAILTLPPRQRAVLVLRYYEDLTERETADVLGVRIGTVKSQCHLALGKLRLVFGDDADLEIISTEGLTA